MQELHQEQARVPRLRSHLQAAASPHTTATCTKCVAILQCLCADCGRDFKLPSFIRALPSCLERHLTSACNFLERQTRALTTIRVRISDRPSIGRRWFRRHGILWRLAIPPSHIRYGCPEKLKESVAEEEEKQTSQWCSPSDLKPVELFAACFSFPSATTTPLLRHLLT